jgi:Protein of unknown function (DUF2948)
MPDLNTGALKLIALDDEDLGILSAHLQDAILRAGDIVYLARESRFALAARRFDWEGADLGLNRRRLSALHFDKVTAVRRMNIDPDAKGATLSLLAITFEVGEAPAGTVTLQFSGGAAIRLNVECIEAQMKDLGPMWETPSRPGHPDDA